MLQRKNSLPINLLKTLKSDVYPVQNPLMEPSSLFNWVPTYLPQLIIFQNKKQKTKKKPRFQQHISTPFFFPSFCVSFLPKVIGFIDQPKKHSVSVQMLPLILYIILSSPIYFCVPPLYQYLNENLPFTIANILLIEKSVNINAYMPVH